MAARPIATITITPNAGTTGKPAAAAAGAPGAPADRMVLRLAENGWVAVQRLPRSDQGLRFQGRTGSGS